VLLFLSFMQTKRCVYLLRLIPIQWSFTPTKKLSGHGLSLMVLMQDSDVLTSFYMGSFFVYCLLTCIELLKERGRQLIKKRKNKQLLFHYNASHAIGSPLFGIAVILQGSMNKNDS
jgi:hypothetical protein